jgi:hypothetical protein
MVAMAVVVEVMFEVVKFVVMMGLQIVVVVVVEVTVEILTKKQIIMGDGERVGENGNIDGDATTAVTVGGDTNDANCGSGGGYGETW